MIMEEEEPSKTEFTSIFDTYYNKFGKLHDFKWENLKNNDTILKPDILTDGILYHSSKGISNFISHYYILTKKALYMYNVRLIRILIPQSKNLFCN